MHLEIGQIGLLFEEMDICSEWPYSTIDRLCRSSISTDNITTFVALV